MTARLEGKRALADLAAWQAGAQLGREAPGQEAAGPAPLVVLELPAPVAPLVQQEFRAAPVRAAPVREGRVPAPVRGALVPAVPGLAEQAWAPVARRRRSQTD